MKHVIDLLQKQWSENEDKVKYSLCGKLDLDAVLAEDNRILDVLEKSNSESLANECTCNCTDNLYVFGIEGKLICCACHRFVRTAST